MKTVLILNGTEINDIDMLKENISDKGGLLDAFRDGSLHYFLESCFYTDEAAAIDGVSEADDDSLYDSIVHALTDNTTVHVVSYGRSDLKKPERKIPEYKRWEAYLKEKSRAFRKKYDPVYSKRSSPLLKRLQIGDERCYLVHDDSLFANGKYGLAVLTDGIAYNEMIGSRKRKFLSFKEIREHGGLVNDEGTPAFRWYADWNKEQKGEKVWIPLTLCVVNEFLDYVNDLVDKHKEFET